MGEEAVNEAHLVDDEQTKGQADASGYGAEIAVQPLRSAAGEVHGRGEGDGDDHHAGDGADAEDEEVGDSPMRVVQGGEHEEGDGCGAGEAMDQTDDEGAAPLVEAPSRPGSVEVIDRRVGVGGGLAAVSVAGVCVEAGDLLAEASQIENAEEDEHDADGKLHGEAETGRDDEREEDDGGADGEDGQRVTGSPERSDQRCARKAALAGDDGGDGDHVIGISGVPHAEEEAEREDSHEAYGCVRGRQSFGEQGEVWWRHKKSNRL